MQLAKLPFSFGTEARRQGEELEKAKADLKKASNSSQKLLDLEKQGEQIQSLLEKAEANFKQSEEAQKKAESALRQSGDTRKKTESDLKKLEEAHRRVEFDCKQLEEGRKKALAESVRVSEAQKKDAIELAQALEAKKKTKEKSKVDIAAIKAEHQAQLPQLRLQVASDFLGSPVFQLGQLMLGAPDIDIGWSKALGQLRTTGVKFDESVLDPSLDEYGHPYAESSTILPLVEGTEFEPLIKRFEKMAEDQEEKERVEAEARAKAYAKAMAKGTTTLEAPGEKDAAKE